MSASDDLAKLFWADLCLSPPAAYCIRTGGDEDMRWLSWNELPKGTRALVSRAADKLLADTKLGIEGAMRELMRGPVEYGVTLRQYLQHVASLSSAGEVAARRERLVDLLNEVNKTAIAGLNTPATLEVPR